MNKLEVLVMGCGGAGNNLVATLKGIDKSYSDFYFNTNIKEMECLPFYEARKAYSIPNANGTGKNKEEAKRYIMGEDSRLANLFAQYKEMKHVILMGSTSGGTGSTACVLFPRLIKSVLPHVGVTVIVALPTPEESERDYENSLRTWMDLEKQSKLGYIDNFMFIDNSKGKDLKVVNTKAMKELNNLFESGNSSLDATDFDNFFLAKGYNIPLKLDEDIDDDVEEAIRKAMKKSVFYSPDFATAKAVLGDMNDLSHKPSTIKKLIPNASLHKFATRESGDSMLFLGGCTVPAQPWNMIREWLKQSKERTNNDLVTEELEFDEAEIGRRDEEAINRILAKPKSSSISDNLQKALQGGSFWGDDDF